MPVYKTKNDDSDHRPREKVGVFFTVNCFFQSAQVNECWGFIINIMWYELIAQAESYI